MRDLQSERSARLKAEQELKASRDQLQTTAEMYTISLSSVFLLSLSHYLILSVSISLSLFLSHCFSLLLYLALSSSSLSLQV